MCKINERKFVCSAFKKNESGFTFVSLLFTLIIILITLPFIGYLVKEITTEQNDGHIIAHQFFVFLYYDTLLADNVYVGENSIYFDLINGETAAIEQYKDMIRRRVEGQGHEIYVRDITTFSLTPLEDGFQVNLTLNNGEMYEKTIAFK